MNNQKKSVLSKVSGIAEELEKQMVIKDRFVYGG